MSSPIETFGSTRLVQDGSLYFLYPNGGSAVQLSYIGAPVAAELVRELQGITHLSDLLHGGWHADCLDRTARWYPDQDSDCWIRSL
jgi:hypothetical protein